MYDEQRTDYCFVLLSEAIHHATVEGKTQLAQSQLLTKERIEKEEVSQQQQLDQLKQQVYVSMNHYTDFSSSSRG